MCECIQVYIHMNVVGCVKMSLSAVFKFTRTKCSNISWCILVYYDKVCEHICWVYLTIYQLYVILKDNVCECVWDPDSGCIIFFILKVCKCSCRLYFSIQEQSV